VKAHHAHNISMPAMPPEKPTIQVDPANLNFVKESSHLVNYSRLPEAIILGSLKTALINHQ
jgi:hypothetical protein